MNNHALPILYTFRRCPYAMRARMAIHMAGIKIQKIEVSLKNKPQSLIDYSPKGTVPVVVTTRGKVIQESRDIMLWALQQADPENWLLKDEKLQQQMEQLIDTCDIQFKPLLDRYKYYDRYPEYSQIEHRQKTEFFLQRLEANLSRHNFLIDENRRLADIAIFPFIRQFAGVDNIWFEESPYKNVKRWLDECINSPLFESVMKK